MRSKVLQMQYLRPSLSYHLSLCSLFCLLLSGCLHRFYCNLEVIACDLLSIYMDHPWFIISNQKEKSITCSTLKVKGPLPVLPGAENTEFGSNYLPCINISHVSIVSHIYIGYLVVQYHTSVSGRVASLASV